MPIVTYCYHLCYLLSGLFYSNISNSNKKYRIPYLLVHNVRFYSKFYSKKKVVHYTRDNYKGADKYTE